MSDDYTPLCEDHCLDIHGTKEQCVVCKLIHERTITNECVQRIATLTAERDALRDEIAIAQARAETQDDAERWRAFVGPQTALMLGSHCDPNGARDWKAECDRLADAIRARPGVQAALAHELPR